MVKFFVKFFYMGEEEGRGKFGFKSGCKEGVDVVDKKDWKRVIGF